MADKSSYVDQAGMTYIVSGINIANEPGQIGTPISLSTTPTYTSVTTGSIVIDATSDITIPSAAVAAAGTGAGSAGHADGAVATHVLPITVGATTYYIPLCNTNAS